MLARSALLITNSDFENRVQIGVRDRTAQGYNTIIDDYMRFIPLAQMYTADIIGIKSKNHWFDQTKNATISLFLNDLLTTELKQSFSKRRPSGQSNTAFPSAHTSYSFTTATVLYEEFKDTSPILAYSGYGFAIAIAYIRISKDAHWFSDVLMGAAVGITITKLVYHFDYLFAWYPFKKTDNLTIAPTYDGKAFGMAGVIRF